MHWNLIADIGGTNARFASVIDGTISKIKTYSSKGEHGLLEAMEEYVSGFDTKPETIVLAVAGYIENDEVHLTNAKKGIKIDNVRKLSSSGTASLINDFEAAAWALATVTKDDVKQLQGSVEFAKGDRIIIGPGTGLGVGTLIDCGEHYIAIPSEGGHVGISPHSEFEVEVFNVLKKLWPEVVIGSGGLRLEAESFLSGTGIPFLYKAICEVLGQECLYEKAEEVFAAAQKDDVAVNVTTSLISSHLGALAGDLALTLSADGGVFISGGVVLKNSWLLNDDFIAAFNDGGRFTGTRKKYPVYLYANEQFGLSGAANALQYKPTK